MSRTEPILKIIVVGAGPAGWAAVQAALEAGVPGNEICLVERGEQPLSGWRSSTLPKLDRPPASTAWQTVEGPLFDNNWIGALASVAVPPQAMTGPRERVIEAISRRLIEAGVLWHPRSKATEVVRNADGDFCVWFEHGTPVMGARLILAPGGGRNHAFRWAEEWGLPLTDRHPAGLNLRLKVSRSRSWSSLSPVRTSVALEKVKGAEGLFLDGFMESTHPWLGGSGVAGLSLVCPALLARARYQGILRVNWLPDLKGGLSLKVVRLFQEQAGRRLLAEFPWEGVPVGLWRFILQAAGVAEEIPWRSLTSRQTQMIGNQLICTRLNFDGYKLDREAGLSAGGIALTALVPGTFEVRNIPGLFWIGEAVDLHALDPVANRWLAEAEGRAAGQAAVLSLG